MDVADFRASLAGDTPDAGLPPPLVALWWMGKGDWNKAHEVAQSQDDSPSAWVHAHLHRQEGDLNNAGWWYRRVGRSAPEQSLDEEWGALASNMLGRR